MTLAQSHRAIENGPDGAKDVRLLRVIVTLCPVLIVIGIWLHTNKYQGLVADGITYTALALYRSDPSSLAGDVMFLNGNAAFSAYPWILAAAVAQIGPILAHVLFVICGQVLWLVSLIALGRTLFKPAAVAWFSIFGVVVLNNNYGFWGSVGYGEMIAAPRIFAEAGIMVALAAFYSGRSFLSVGLALASIAIHPLMAGPGLLLISMLRFGMIRGFLIVSLPSVLAVLALSFAGVAPFTLLGQSFDAEWTRILKDSFPHAFFANWLGATLTLSILPVGVLVLATQAKDDHQARLSRYVLAVFTVMLAIEIIGSAALNDIFIKNLHLWRFLWLATVLGNMLAIPIALDPGYPIHVRILLSITILLSVFESSVYSYPYATSVGILIVLAVQFLTNRVGPVASRVIFFCADFAMAILSIAAMTVAAVYLTQGSYYLTRIGYWSLYLAILGISAAALHALHRKRLSTRAALGVAVIAAALFGKAALQIDTRPDWRKYLESEAALPAEIREAMLGKAVYVEDGPEVNWLLLRQPSFFSCVQTVPFLIDRDVAIEIHRRGDVLRHLNTVDFRKQEIGYCMRKADPEATGPKTRSQLYAACTALPDLDVMVLYDDVPDANGRRWALPDTAWESPPTWMTEKEKEAAMKFSDFFIYDCDQLRSM